MNKLEIQKFETKIKRFYILPKTRFLLVLALIILLLSLAIIWFCFFRNVDILQKIKFPVSNRIIQIALLIVNVGLYSILPIIIFVQKENKLLLILWVILFLIIMLGTIISGFIIFHAINLLVNLTEIEQIKKYIYFTISVIFIFLVLFYMNLLFLKIVIDIFKNKSAIASE